MAPLDRAFALAQVNDVAVAVGQDLNLNMARLLDELFDENPVVAETGLGFVGGQLETFATPASS